MSDYLCISVRFLDGAFHGRGDGGAPEWPPSPLRLFQALVAAAAARWNERRGLVHAAPALRWLESLPPPSLVAPHAAAGAAYRLYVPDNVGDLVGKAWSRGNEASVADYRTEKMVRPTRPEQEAVHYLWPLAPLGEDLRAHRDILLTAARSITHLGWGVDLVVADASVITNDEANALPGQRWQPSPAATGTTLRTPTTGTLADLARRHDAFLHRVSGEMFSPVPPLSAFKLAGYLSDAEPPRSPCALFALRKLDDTGFRAYDPVRRSAHVAGMVRHVTGSAAMTRSLGWTADHVAKFVHGHASASDSQVAINAARLVFLPLPSIEYRGDGGGPTVGSIRRVLITSLGPTNREEFDRLAQHLAGQELIDEKSGASTAMISLLPVADNVTQRYLGSAATWATVTPVVLPGYDDPRKLRQRLRPENAAKLTADDKASLLAKLDDRIDFLIRKAIRQAGYSEALARHAEIEWRASGYWPGTALASQYAAGDQHRRFRRLHVRITWRDETGNPIDLPGPICFGSGKFSGMGLFAAVSP